MCGIFGAFSSGERPVLEDVYLGLYALQHRGQESAGVAWINGNRDVHSIKGSGLVHLALDQEELSKINTSCAIGHVRYSTSGGSELNNAQPLTATSSRGAVAIAHNGNLTNANEIKSHLESRGAIFQSRTDTESILHLMAHQPHKTRLDAFVDSLPRLRGAYSLLLVIDDRIVAARDPWGFRPLILGKREDVFYVSSESCALDLVGADIIREVEPGEVVVIDKKGISSLRIPLEVNKQYSCSFEQVYFARPDSMINGRSVYGIRKALGAKLAMRAPCKDADFVTGMPDSGTISAIGFSEESRLPYEKAIVRNRYVGRTFIEPTQRVRELGVKIKLNPIKELIKGKKIVIIDDSIVRGTTCQRMISMIRENGAREVHLRISSPPVRFPCYYGIDTPTREELAAARMNVQQIAQQVGADSLAFLTEEDLLEAIGTDVSKTCTACFTGRYMEGEQQNVMEL
jgi:amidophosphoribosyltransferase